MEAAMNLADWNDGRARDYLSGLTLYPTGGRFLLPDLTIFGD